MRIQGIVMMVAACAVAGCSQLEGLGSVLGGPGAGSAQTGQVEAEIRAVNTSSQELDIRTTDGQDARIRYDNQTRVIYQDQEYPVTALEYGDLVVMNVQQSGNTYYTDVIQVRQSVQDRSGAGSNTLAACSNCARAVRQLPSRCRSVRVRLTRIISAACAREIP